MSLVTWAMSMVLLNLVSVQWYTQMTFAEIIKLDDFERSNLFGESCNLGSLFGVHGKIAGHAAQGKQFCDDEP